MAKGYRSESSPFMFRSGLDGDTRYFQDAIQSVLHPYTGRTLSSVVFPAFVPIGIALAWMWKGKRGERRRMGRQLAFTFAPYLFSLALFPQSVAIHPYLYDGLIVLPAAIIGATWLLGRHQESALRGTPLLAGLLLAALLIMANPIAIAQGIQRVLPH